MGPKKACERLKRGQNDPKKDPKAGLHASFRLRDTLTGEGVGGSRAPTPRTFQGMPKNATSKGVRPKKEPFKVKRTLRKPAKGLKGAKMTLKRTKNQA